MPLSNRRRTRLVFLDSLSFFDSAANGRPNFLPATFKFAKDNSANKIVATCITNKIYTSRK